MSERLVTAFDLETNRRAARAAIKAEMRLYRNADWGLYSRTFNWFQHRKRMDQSAQDWFEATWREIHQQRFAKQS